MRNTTSTRRQQRTRWTGSLVTGLGLVLATAGSSQPEEGCADERDGASWTKSAGASWTKRRGASWTTAILPVAPPAAWWDGASWT